MERPRVLSERFYLKSSSLDGPDAVLYTSNDSQLGGGGVAVGGGGGQQQSNLDQTTNQTLLHQQTVITPAQLQKIGKACEKLLQQLTDLSSQLMNDDFWDDCNRLIERVSIFQPFITKILENDNDVLTVLLVPKKANELQFLFETLELIKTFIINHRERISYLGITESATRDLYINDIAKLNHRIIRLSEGFNLIETQKESSFIQRRKEDMKDAKASFKAAVLRVLDELTNIEEEPSHYIYQEEEFQQLINDVSVFQEGLSHFLSLMKHHPLSVYEARALKMELKKLTNIIEIRKDQFYKICEKKKYEAPLIVNPPATTTTTAAGPLQANKGSLYTGLTASVSPLAGGNNESFYSANYSAITDDPSIMNNQQVHTKQNKILEQYRLSPTDIKFTKAVIEYGNFGNIFLGVFKNVTKIMVRKIIKKETHLEYLAERLLLMHHLGTPSANISTNLNHGGIQGMNHHPNLQQFYGFISSEHSYHMIEELTNNGILDAVLQDTTQFPFLQINLRMAWIVDILSGMEFLHSKGIVHSEITPGNILISDKLRLKLGNLHSTSDIIARYHGKSNEKLQEVYKILLTSPYLAPEMKEMITNNYLKKKNAPSSVTTMNTFTNNKLEFTIENDIYSFMITCFVIIFRRLPVIEEDLMEQFHESFTYINFHSEDAKRYFEKMMLSIMQYKKLPNNVAPEIILVDRPKSDMLMPIAQQIMEELGGDPRIVIDEHHPEAIYDDNTYLAELEVAIAKLQSQRIHSTGFQDLLQKSSFLKSTSYDNHQNVSNNLSRLVPRRPLGGTTKRPYSIRNMAKSLYANQPNNKGEVSLENAADGANPRRFSMNGSAIPNLSVYYNKQQNEFLQHSPTGVDYVAGASKPASFIHPTVNSEAYLRAENISHLIQFLREDGHCTSSNAKRYAEILVNKGIPTIPILTRRVDRENNLLIKFGFNLNDAIEINNAVKRILQQLKKNNNNKSGGGGGGGGLAEDEDILSFLRNKSGENSSKSKSSREKPRLYLPTDIANLYERATLQNDEEALQQLERLASNGDQFARGFLMRMYAQGNHHEIKQDLEIAKRLGEGLLNWLDVISQSENEFAVMIAMFLMGVCYSEGVGGAEKDVKEAMQWYRRSADKNYSMAQAYLGYCYYVGKGCLQNHLEAYSWYKRAAEQGHPGAQSNLGLCYENGHGVPANAFEAVKWYKLAAEQGYGVASYNLAYCYENGKGLPNKDYHKAFYYYLLAAVKQHYLQAEYRLGLLFEENLVSIDDEDILHMKQTILKKTAAAAAAAAVSKDEGGDDEVQNRFVSFATSPKAVVPSSKSTSFYASTDHSENSDEGIEQKGGDGVQRSRKQQKKQANDEEAFSWYLSSASKGFSESQVKVGNYYEYGIGTTANAVKAFEYYELAAKQGNTVAKYLLGYCYSTGTGTVPDIDKAIYYYLESAKEGNLIAQNNVAYFYHKGYGVEKNLEEAMKWYQKSAEKGYAPAKYNLAYLYEKFSMSNGAGLSPKNGTSNKNNNNSNNNGRLTSIMKPVKIQEIMNLYMAAADGGVTRAKIALNRIKN